MSLSRFRSVLTGLCLATLCLAALPATANPATSNVAPDSTLVSISARAEASRVPDVATLSAGVVTQATQAEAAMRDNARQMNQVMSAIRAAGVAEKDIRTSGIDVNPQYRRTQDDQPPTITGYQASNTVSLKVRDIARLGDVLDALVASGANQINGPSFEIDQPDAVYDEARRAALEKARARAAMYAEALGLRVRRIVSISEGGGTAPPMPMMAMRAAAYDSAGSTPVAPGETTLSAELAVVFELGR